MVRAILFELRQLYAELVKGHGAFSFGWPLASQC